MREDLQALLRHSKVKVRTLDELAAPLPRASLSLAALRGRFIELAGGGASAVLSAAVELVVEAQLAREPAAWISLAESCFYPPDVAACGVDLSALVVVRAATVAAAARATEQLLRSGAFGVAVLDLCAPQRVLAPRAAPPAGLPMAVQSRLVGLAQRHQCLAVCLTEARRGREPNGSLVSLRAEALREHRGGQWQVIVRALKDKRHGPGWSQSRLTKPPEGMA